MSEEQLKELREYNLEYLEARESEEIFGGDYTSAVELKYAKKEIERLNNIINELEKDMRERYHKEIDYQSKIMQSDLMQGDYPVSYYYAEQNEKLLSYYLNKLQELKGSNENG